MSMFTTFLRRVFGQSMYDQLKQEVTVSALNALTSKVQPWVTTRLAKAGLPLEEAQAVSAEIIAYAGAAILKG